MTNVPVRVIGNVTQTMFAQRPSSFSQLTTKVAQFTKRNWPYLIVGILAIAVIAGIVVKVTDNKK